MFNRQKLHNTQEEQTVADKDIIDHADNEQFFDIEAQVLMSLPKPKKL